MRYAKLLIILPILWLLATGVSPGQQAGQKSATTPPAGQHFAPQLTDYYAHVLMLSNQGEIELAKIALERSTNPEVKQLAQKLIDEHTQMNAKLKQLSPTAGESLARADATGGPRRTAARDTAQHDLLTELCRINRQAADNHLKQSKELLNRYKGQDFDMAFLGMTIGSHTWLASELDALNDVGSGQLKQVVDAASQQVRHHLEVATTLSGKIEDERRAASARENTK